MDDNKDLVFDILKDIYVSNMFEMANCGDYITAQKHCRHCITCIYLYSKTLNCSFSVAYRLFTNVYCEYVKKLEIEEKLGN